MQRMLIVEDEQDICDCLGQFFGSRGFAVAFVFSGEEAMECIYKDTVDVVLLDILLPGISGIEVLKRIREFDAKIRVIMVTGLEQSNLRLKAHKYGAAAYITKPFDFSEFTWASVFERPY